MSTYTTKGSFTYKAPDGVEYEMDYDATLEFGENNGRPDRVTIEPSFGEVISEEHLEEWQDALEEIALEKANEKLTNKE